MSTQVLVWLGSVFVVLVAAAVLWALTWAVCWSVAWAWSWWRFRGDDQDGHAEGHEDDGESIGLPPERTWEQITSHQLPVVGMSARERKDWEHREGVRRRGAMRVEMTHRAHYAAMGLEYPSGLMARVRELTPAAGPTQADVSRWIGRLGPQI